MVQKHVSYITTATAKFPTSGPDFKAKIGFLSDSTTDIGRWKALTIPIGDIEHLSAKSRRFFSWSDICAGTHYWPFTINHLSGDNISLPHMLSHLGNLARTKAKELTAVGINTIVAPMCIHSYHNGHQRDATGVDEMGYRFNSLTISASDITEMKRACLADESAHLGVHISTIYRIIALGDTQGFDAALLKRVMAWKDTVFFAHTAPNTEAPVLYTPASMQVLMWPNVDEDRPDLTKMLVTVVSSMAMVRLTTMDTIIAQEEMEQGHYVTHDLRFDAMLLSHNYALNTAVWLRRCEMWQP